MSLRGYWRTESDRIDCNPAIRITRLTTTARTGRLMKRSVNFIGASVVLGLGGGVVPGRRGVVDVYGGAVAQLEDPRGHDLGAGLDAGEHRHLVAAARAHLHELLARPLVRRL